MSDKQWTHDPETGEDVWTAERLTVAQLATLAGSKAEVAKACGVSARTVGAWRSGLVAKVPFRAVVAMCALGGYSLDEISAEPVGLAGGDA